jgi:diguanylate cyclase (GGDEF)-like protein
MSAMEDQPAEQLRIAGADDAAEVVRRLLGAASEDMGADRVAVWLFDAELRSLSPYLSGGSRARSNADKARKWAGLRADTVGLVAELLAGATHVVIDDAASDPRLPAALARDFKLRSAYAALLADGKPLGILTVEPASAALGAPSDKLDEVSRSLATACELAQAWQEAARGRAEAEFLLDLVDLAGPERSVQDVLEMVCTRLSQQVDVERACVFLISEGQLVPRMAQFADGRRDMTAWRLFKEATEPFPLAEEVLRRKAPVVAEDPHSPLVGGWWSETFDIVTGFGVPIGDAAQMKGVLTLDSSVPQRFQESHVRLATTAGIRLGEIVDRTQENEDRLSHLRSAEAMLQVLEEGSTASCVEEAAHTLAGVARSALHTDHAVAYVGDNGTAISHVIANGLEEKESSFLRRNLLGMPSNDFGVWRRTLEETEPIFVDDAMASDLIPPDLARLLELGSYTSIPLLTKTGPLGLVICSNHKRTHRWTLSERLLARRLMLEGSLIIDNARLRSAEQLRVAELAHQAYHDHLTGLPNRALLFDRLGQLQAMSRRDSTPVGFLLIDLDMFKQVNDTLGHLAGDYLLQQFAKKLRELLRQSDTVARFGGDEFAILLPGVDRQGARRVAEKICSLAATPFEVEGKPVTLGASVGIAMFPADAEDVDELIHQADLAMYDAKRARDRGLSSL